MATIPEGIKAGHFDVIFTHWAETITLNRYKGEKSNISGGLSDDYEDNEDITGILVKPKQEFNFLREGEVEEGKGYLLLKYADNSSNPLVKEDKITVNNESFKIDTALNRRDLYYYHKISKID